MREQQAIELEPMLQSLDSKIQAEIDVILLWSWNRIDIEAFTLIIELLTWVNALLNEELSIPSDPGVFETLHNDKLMTAIESKRDVSLVKKEIHKLETLTQQAFE